jgi:alpha-D-ribose 1-methylphosphonate 5-phosphate C-P lyase
MQYKERTKSRVPEREHMVDLILFAMVIASAASLLVVSPRQAHQKTLRALREYDDIGPIRAYPDEDSTQMDELV